jgi:hypothetical protein
VVDVAELTEEAQSAPSRATSWLARGSLCLAVVALLALSYRYMDLLGDSFWSVATGRYILQHGQLPTTDPFSFTANRPWIVHMPLSQVCFAWVEAHFGILSLELFGALLSTAALSLVWFPHARGMPARCVTFGALLWLIMLQSDDLCVRGQLFGDLAFVVLLLCMFRLHDGKKVRPWFACLLGSAWMNLHSSAFLGLVLPLAWAALLRLQRSRPLLVPYLEFAALFGLGLFLNPYGPRLVLDVWQLLRSESTRQIDLFRPPDFGAPTTWVTFLLLGLAIGACFRRARVQFGAGLAEGSLLVLWAIAAATGRRYLPLALMFAIAVGARELSARWAARAEPSDRRSALVWVLALTIVATGTAFFGLSADKDPFRDVPFEEAAIIERLPLPDHVANIYHWGGFLDYAWDGRRKTFVDGRNQLFEHGAFADERRLATLQNWSEVLTRYRINTVLWERGSALDLALSRSAEWQPVRRGRIAVLYVRKQPLSVPR